MSFKFKIGEKVKAYNEDATVVCHSFWNGIEMNVYTLKFDYITCAVKENDIQSNDSRFDYSLKFPKPIRYLLYVFFVAIFIGPVVFFVLSSRVVRWISMK